MFVRVSEFGTANREAFPETSTGGQVFAEVASAVAAIEDHMKKRVVARAEAQKVKSATRAAVMEYMKAIARTGRMLAVDESEANRFKMPTRQSAAAVLSTARAFIQEAEARQAEFIRFGMPETFISDFTKLVNTLEAAVNVQLNSRTLRHRAQKGIEAALADGLTATRTLDVVVTNQLREDPVGLAAWHGARHIEGLPHATSDHDTPAPAPVPAPAPLGGVPAPGDGEAARTS
jgi:hypothetical protein